MSTTVQLPAVPESTPVLVETSHSFGDSHHDIDTDTQWWCEATRRPNLGDAFATVTAPGAGLYNPLVMVALPAGDLDDAEETGRYAVDVTRQLVRVLGGDDDGMAELKRLLGPSGPMGGESSHAWAKVFAWLRQMRQGNAGPLSI